MNFHPKYALFFHWRAYRKMCVSCLCIRFESIFSHTLARSLFLSFARTIARAIILWGVQHILVLCNRMNRAQQQTAAQSYRKNNNNDIFNLILFSKLKQIAIIAVFLLSSFQAVYWVLLLSQIEMMMIVPFLGYCSNAYMQLHTMDDYKDASFETRTLQTENKCKRRNGKRKA